MTDWHEYEQDRLFAEAERKTAAQWAEYRAEKQRRLAEMDRRHERRHKIAPSSWEYALNRIALLLCFVITMLTSAGIIAWMQ